jgi:hypothetical protein
LVRDAGELLHRSHHLGRASHLGLILST